MVSRLGVGAALWVSCQLMHRRRSACHGCHWYPNSSNIITWEKRVVKTSEQRDRRHTDEGGGGLFIAGGERRRRGRIVISCMQIYRRGFRKKDLLQGISWPRPPTAARTAWFGPDCCRWHLWRQNSHWDTCYTRHSGRSRSLQQQQQWQRQHQGGSHRAETQQRHGQEKQVSGVNWSKTQGG